MKHASREIISNLCISRSKLYPIFKKFHLVKNMRLLHSTNPQWEQFLLSVGDGTAESDEHGNICVPSYIKTTSVLEKAIEFI